MSEKREPIRIRRQVLNRMIEHAQGESPVECCGLLSGRGSLIDGITPTRNARRSTTEFEIPPPELFQFVRRLRAAGREFLGVYHSHPASPPFPSPKDAAEFYYPEVTYWIVSLQGKQPQVRCFRWGKMGFEETPFEIVE